MSIDLKCVVLFIALVLYVNSVLCAILERRNRTFRFGSGKFMLWVASDARIESATSPVQQSKPFFLYACSSNKIKI